jgi:hypothetical protein
MSHTTVMCAPMKRCTKCGELKPESEFYPAPGCKDGLRGRCKSCHLANTKARYAQDPAPTIAYVKKWQQEHPDRLREYRRKNRERRAAQMRRLHLRSKFGMTVEDYDNILAAQDGGCAICGDQPVEGQSMHIDHWQTDVRGILCVRCNNGLGQFKESPELLLRAAEYVRLGGFAPLDVVRRDVERNNDDDR